MQSTRESTGGSTIRASYWQSVLQAGLPVLFFYLLIDYFVSHATTGVRFRYPFWFEVTTDVVVVLVVSALHWWKAKGRRA